MHEPPDIDPEIDKNGLRSKKTKNKFTDEEDNIIKKFVQDFGAHTWGRIAPLLPGRTPRQVRERWVNYLSPEIKLDEWTKEEDDLIMRLVAKFGKKWAYISRSFNQRTDVSIKNRYFLLQRREKNDIRKNLMSQLSKKKLNQLENQLKNVLPPVKSPSIAYYQVLESPQYQPQAPAIQAPIKQIQDSQISDNKIAEGVNTNVLETTQSLDINNSSNDFYDQGVLEEQNYQIGMYDSDNEFSFNNDLINDFEFQFFL